MNERIKQLAIEAKLIASEPNGFDQNNLSKAQQKFAELIVKECAHAVAQHNTLSYQQSVPFNVSQVLNNHFGVE
jgi:hypothetical protein